MKFQRTFRLWLTKNILGGEAVNFGSKLLYQFTAMILFACVIEHAGWEAV